MYYKLTNFNFSHRAKYQILKLFETKLKTISAHRLETQHTYIKQLIAGKEIAEFLLSKNLQYNTIDVFFSNVKELTYTNPHVDVEHKNDTYYPIRSRFNIKVIGSSSDSMLWWNTVLWNDLIEQEFFDVNNNSYKSLGILGKTVEERYEYLGPPSCRLDNLLSNATFFNTAYAHSLVLNPGPRIILSVSFDTDIFELVKRFENEK